MKTVHLNEEVVNKKIGSEADVIKQALRGHATEYERRAKDHDAQLSGSIAAWIYSIEANVLRNVLRREFGDE